MQAASDGHAFPCRRIGPVDVAVLTYSEALAVLKGSVSQRAGVLAFANAHSINLARANADFARAMQSCLVLNDGIGVDLASQLLHGQRFPANLNGTDFTPALLDAIETPLRVFLLGSPPGIAEQAAARFVERFPRHQVAGTMHGFFKPQDEAAVIARIKESGADIVLVGMGQPRQEFWAVAARSQIDATLLCIGAYIDFLAGRVSRAPRLVQRLRLEWAYRLMLEPRRLARRYLIGNVTFLYHLARDHRRLRRGA